MATANREADISSGPSRGSERGPEAFGQATNSYIAPGTKINGEISGKTELVIDGEFEGQVRLDQTVTVGSQGFVKGEIAARTVRVGGKVQGNLRAADKVEVLATGTIEGDVISPRITIADGAFLKGKVEMIEVDLAKETAKAQQLGGKNQPSSPEKPTGSGSGAGS